jgi:hypothetical protein
MISNHAVPTAPVAAAPPLAELPPAPADIPPVLPPLAPCDSSCPPQAALMNDENPTLANRRQVRGLVIS